MGNKIDEYKKKLNHDVWADVSGIPFQQETEAAWVDEAFADVWFDVTETMRTRKLLQASIREYHASNSKKRRKSGESE